MAFLATFLIAAADEGTGRGNDPSGLGGGAILAIVLAVVVLGAIAAYFLVARLQSRRRGGTPEEPHRRGRVGRL